MALKALMIKQKLDLRKKALDALISKDEEFTTRESEIESMIREVGTDEEQAAVEKEIAEFEAAKNAHAEEKARLEREVADLEAELAEEEKAQEVEVPVERKDESNMEKNVFRTELQERTQMFAREDVKSYLAEVRSCIAQKRALTNVGVTIPEVFLGILRENLIRYSKLYRHCNVVRLGGDGRLAVQGTIPEAVWTEACANLNELSMAFNQVEVGCWKVGGYFAVCNAVLEDSDIDLAALLLDSIAKAIGLALDKAILYGTGNHMPLGVVTRLVQSSAPAGYPALAPTWTDLSSTNVKTIDDQVTDAALFKELILDSAAMKSTYSRGEKVWVMNETTYTTLIANSMTINAAGAIVAGVNGQMPVIGGVIEVLNFVPDNIIIGGYFDLYLLAERAGQKFATSEHVRFLADETVFKGTARYDGTPIADAAAFVVIGINDAVPDDTMTFASDTANL